MKRLPYTKSLAEAFDIRVIKSDGCWGWIGTIQCGYPKISSQLMHRWMLEQKLGRKLQRHEQCRHKCGNRTCTNPDHLEVGSNSDNQKDRRGHHGGKFGPSYLFTTDQEIQIAKEYKAGGISYTKLAQKHRTTKSHISHILRRHKCQLQNTESHTK
jgi:hypothetical protein